MNQNCPSILLIEDEAGIREFVLSGLEDAGCRTVALPNGDQMEAVIDQFQPDLMILDRGLPGRTGSQLLRVLRGQPQWANLPVIMLTGDGAVSSRVQELDAGADDYIVKPFDVSELVARVNSVLRRVHRANEVVAGRDATTQDSGELTHGPLLVDTKAHRVLVKDVEVSLTLTEYRILRELILARDEVVPRRALLERVLGRQDGGERSVDVHVAALRRKIGAEAASSIETVRGVGYRISTKSDTDLSTSSAS
jgi:DNA-binding response OmpR family regulator